VAVSVVGSSDIYRITVIGRNVGPAGDYTAARKIEMRVRLESDEEVTILSWKEIHE